MELATIEMEEEKAKEAFEEYHAAVKERHDDEDAEIMRAYKELAKGTPLIRLTAALVAGGSQVKSFRRHRRADPEEVRVPQLSVARADSDYAWTHGIRPEGSLRIQGKREVADNNRRDVIEFPDGTFEESEIQVFGRAPWDLRINAMVPTVPPALRPKHSLSNYHVLWEAEWALAPDPPKDPALLKHIVGDLYAVLAVWDLTEVERAVLARREPE